METVDAILMGTLWVLTLGLAYNMGQIEAYKKCERTLNKAVRDKWEALKKAEQNQ